MFPIFGNERRYRFFCFFKRKRKIANFHQVIRKHHPPRGVIRFLLGFSMEKMRCRNYMNTFMHDSYCRVQAIVPSPP